VLAETARIETGETDHIVANTGSKEARGTVTIFSRRFFPSSAETESGNGVRQFMATPAANARQVRADQPHPYGKSFRNSFVVFSAGERNEKCSATIRR